MVELCGETAVLGERGGDAGCEGVGSGARCKQQSLLTVGVVAMSPTGEVSEVAHLHCTATRGYVVLCYAFG